MSRVATIFAAALMISGCAAGFGPHNGKGKDALQDVRSALPAAQSTVEVFTTSLWFPDTRGMPGFGESMMRGGMDMRPGVFVLTDDAAMFLRWQGSSAQPSAGARPPAGAKLPESDGRYSVVYRVSYAELEQVEAVKHGRNHLLVLAGKDLRPQTFAVDGKDGLKNTQMAEHLARLIEGHRKP